MFYHKEEKFIKDLEKSKNPQVLMQDFLNRLSSSKDKQSDINLLYQQLSIKGTKNLNKLIYDYNKQHTDAKVKTYTQVISDYKDKIEAASNMLLKSGHRYGKEDFETDRELRREFYNIMDSVRPECMQDIINEINKYIDNAITSQNFSLEKDVLCVNAFKSIVHDFGDKNLLRLYISNINVVDDEVKKLQNIYKNVEDIKEFKDAMIKSCQTIEPADFQAVINRLDRELDYKGSKAVDSVVQSINNHSENKFETRRVLLTEKEKDSSWQKFEHESILSKKLRELNERLQEIKRNREHPNDKYDRNFISSTMRVLTNLQNIIAEAADFIRTHIVEYYASLNKEQEVLKKEPFYEVMVEAYKEKGKAIVDGINSGELTKEEAQNLFVMDISYIKTQNLDRQTELFNAYAQNITMSLREKEIKASTKNIMYTLIANYEQSKFDKEIEYNIKNGCHWDKDEEIKSKKTKSSINKENDKAKEDVSVHQQPIHTKASRQKSDVPQQVTVSEIIDAFNNNKNPESKFAEWVKGKEEKDIQAGVYQIDKALDGPEPCFRFVEVLTDNRLSNIKTPHCDMFFENQYEEIYR